MDTQNQVQTQAQGQAVPKSKFTGGLLGLIVVQILSFLMTVLTLFIAYPFAVCYKENWIAKHTIIDGRQVKFEGNGMQLWGQYIKWVLLSIITLGIYLLWLGIAMRKWVASKTHLGEFVPENN